MSALGQKQTGWHKGTHVPRFARLCGSSARACQCDGTADRDIHRTRPQDVEAILDKHYLGRDVRLAENAVRKLERKERRTKTVKCR
jgi:hypothetical protein